MQSDDKSPAAIGMQYNRLRMTEKYCEFIVNISHRKETYMLKNLQITVFLICVYLYLKKTTFKCIINKFLKIKQLKYDKQGI